MEALSKNDPVELETALKTFEEMPKTQKLVRDETSLIEFAKLQKKELERTTGIINNKLQVSMANVEFKIWVNVIFLGFLIYS